MDRLSSCYFCGTATDAPVEEYPVVPADLGPGDEQMEVALCPSCREKLAGIVARVVEVAESDEPADVTNGLVFPDSAGSDTPDEPAAADAPADEGPASEEPADAPADPADPGAGADEPSADPDSGAGRIDDGREPASPDDAHDSGAPGSQDSAPSGDVSVREYRRVMRLLGNREFPVDVSEIEAIATSAYDLSPAEFEEILDAAERRGVVERAGGELRRAG